MKTFDHIILGTGQATGTLLGGLLKTGESIAVIEGKQVGGTCVNTGCTPTKTLVASAKVAHMIRRSEEFGISVDNAQVDFTRVRERMNSIRYGNRDGFEKWLKSDDRISFFKEWGKFVDLRKLQVGEEIVEGKKIYINVGTRARAIDLPGLDSVPWLNNEGLLDMEELPEHLIILGGSYIGLEFGQMFHRFGSKVSILEASSQIMIREDKDVADAAREILTEEGLDIHENAQVDRVDRDGTNGVKVSYTQNGESLTVSGSHLLLAVGRIPNSDTLNLSATGLETDERGYIPVDDYCRTAVEGVFGVGDVNRKGAFTHTSVNDAEIILSTLQGGDRKISDRIPIYAMFIDPPLGRVGMSEKEALASGRKVLKAVRKMDRINRAKEMGETEGFAKILVDRETDRFLGATVFGVGGDEIINMFAAMMYSDVPCMQLRKSVFVHPTIAELMPWILDDLEPIN